MHALANLILDDATIDFAGRRLLRGGVEQTLEPKAFAVLALLASSPGQLFTRDEILDAVWGHRHVTPGVLNRVMTLLRHGLGESAHAPRYLHTVHGVGYRFDLPAPAVVAKSEPATAAVAMAEGVPSEAALEGSGVVPASAVAALVPVRGRRAGDVAPAEPVTVAVPARRRRVSDAASTGMRWRRQVALPVMLLMLLAIVGWQLWPVATPAVVPAEQVVVAAGLHSIAVLPLINSSGDQEQQFFSDGISENLIDTLSSYDGLKVIGRSSSFRFRNSQVDSRSIGAQLGVAYLVAGSVQRVDDRVRIAVELVDTADGRTLGTQRFDRPYKNLFALQDELALTIAGWLQVKLPHNYGTAGAVEHASPSSGNLEAYAAFLRGSYFLLRDGDKAIEQFSAATRLDPGYAQAWQWLGFVRAINARRRPADAAVRADCALAHEEIETAIRLAPGYGLGYSSLAVQLTSCAYDWDGALAQYRKAMPLVSANSPAHGHYSRLLASLGRVDEAIDERRKQLDGDPLMGEGYYWLFQMQSALGRLDDADTSLRKMIALDTPENAASYADAQAYLALLRGDVGAALTQLKRLPEGRQREQAEALFLQAGSNRADADAALQSVLKLAAENRFDGLLIARAYALRGDADGMFAWLNRDWEQRGMAAYRVLYDPLLLRFRDDPRMAAFCKRAGLPSPATSEALGIEQIRASYAAGSR